MNVLNTGGIPLSALSPKYLHTNSTSHTWPFSAIAELIDNAYDPDVMAKKFWIDLTRIKGFDCLTFQDNGKGMTKEGMHKMLSFGFSEKQAARGHAPVGLYGNGFKSSSMRLGKDTIVFSKIKNTMSVGMLSQSYLQSIQAKYVVVPIVTIGHDGQSPVEDAASLQDILKHSPFNTAEELLTELRAITSISPTGTRIIIWNLRRGVNGETEFDLSTDRYDIRIPEDACETHKNQNVTQSIPAVIYSLCAYCSFLYLKPRMQIIIRGQKVKMELISKSLALTRKDQYKPVFLKERIPITFGYTKSKDQYGMMMYHKNRLIKAFERVGCQRKGGFRGVGVIGVIECNFLQPTHNKQDFDDTDEYRKTMANLAVKLEEYWDEIEYKRKECSLLQTEDNVPDQNWVQCDDCQKWRRLPDGIDCNRLPRDWFCCMNPNPQYRNCEAAEELEDSEHEQQCDPKPYKRQKKMIKMQEKKDQQQMSAPALPLLATPLSCSEQWRPAEDAPAGLSSESFTHPSCSGHNLPNDTMLMDCEDNVSTSLKRKKNNKRKQKNTRQQMSAPVLPLPATPLSDSEQWGPAEGAPAGLSSEILAHPSCSGHNVPNDTMLMDCEDHVSTSPERVKQVPPHAVGVSSIDTENTELAAPSVPHMISVATQMSIKQEETWGETGTEETCENRRAGDGLQSQMLEVQQPDGLLDTYKEQVNQLQQELEEMKCECENLQKMKIEHEMLQNRLEDMVIENSSLSYQCEQLNRELEQLRTNGGTGMPSPGEEAQNNVNISSQEDTCRKLRNLRQRIGHLLVTFVPMLDLEEINFDSDVMDKILDRVLNEVNEV